LVKSLADQRQKRAAVKAAVTALSTAAHGHTITVYEMAEVMIADRDIRSGESNRA
jgi:hypothetical protein